MIHPGQLSLGKSLCAVVAALALCAMAQPVRAAAPPAAPATTTPPSGRGPLIVEGLDPQTGTLRLLMNKSITLTTRRPYKRLQISEPGIADVNSIGTTRVIVRGVKAGTTQLTLWDDEDESQTVEVIVQANLLQLREMYTRLMPHANIDVLDNQGIIALTGQVPTVGHAEKAEKLAKGYGSSVMNLLEVAGGQQVMLQIRFAEVSRSATSQLGFNFGYTDGSSFGGSNVGQIAPFSVVESSVTPDTVILGVPGGGAAVTQFGQAAFNGVLFDYFISALRDNNLLRVLAEPNLVAISGQEADFLAGGDFPIPIVQGGNDQGTSITVEFREFGVKLNFLPVVLGDGRIRLRLNPEVSDVDFSNAVIAQGFRIPGRRTRRLSTTVELNDGQTFAVGGLLDNRVAANKQATPLLGDVPVLGALFRSVRYQRNETELVVLVTPRLVRAANPGDVPALPGEDWRHPSEIGMFLTGDIGAPRDTTSKMPQPARRFIGSYGFVPATQPSSGR